ncbi:MAG: hypothetical protein R3F43_31975 [bacterium]
MAMSLHLFVVATQVPNVPENLPFGVALVLIRDGADDERGLHRVSHVAAEEEKW